MPFNPSIANPLRYIFENELIDDAKLEVRHRIPYPDLEHLGDERRRRLVEDEMRPLEFGHTLADQVGGQLEAGLLLSGSFEDRISDADSDPISRYIASFIATIGWASCSSHPKPLPPWLALRDNKNLTQRMSPFNPQSAISPRPPSLSPSSPRTEAQGPPRCKLPPCTATPQSPRRTGDENEKEEWVGEGV